MVRPYPSKSVYVTESFQTENVQFRESEKKKNEHIENQKVQRGEHLIYRLRFLKWHQN